MKCRKCGVPGHFSKDCPTNSCAPTPPPTTASPSTTPTVTPPAPAAFTLTAPPAIATTLVPITAANAHQHQQQHQHQNQRRRDDGTERDHHGRHQDRGDRSPGSPPATATQPLPEDKRRAGPPSGFQNATQVFVHNIPPEVSEADLKAFFQKEFGGVSRVYVPKDKATGRARNYCFVHFTDIAKAELLKQRGSVLFLGRQIIVADAAQKAKENEPKSGGSGGGAGAGASGASGGQLSSPTFKGPVGRDSMGTAMGHGPQRSYFFCFLLPEEFKTVIHEKFGISCWENTHISLVHFTPPRGGDEADSMFQSITQNLSAWCPDPIPISFGASYQQGRFLAVDIEVGRDLLVKISAALHNLIDRRGITTDSKSPDHCSRFSFALAGTNNYFETPANKYKTNSLVRVQMTLTLLALAYSDRSDPEAPRTVVVRQTHLGADLVE